MTIKVSLKIKPQQSSLRSPAEEKEVIAISPQKL